MKKKSVLKFSICIPTYNGGTVIAPTIKSILNQSFTDFELIIIDDCSSDNTVEIIEGINDPRIKLFKNEQNLGYSGNIEECRKKAKNEILFLMGQDDILADNVLLRIHNIFSESKDVGAVTRGYYWFDESVEKPVRAKFPSSIIEDKTITIKSNPKDIIKMFSSLDQLSGLAYRKEFIDLPFHKDIFPCHVYPFASIFKRHPIIFLKGYTVAVRIGTSQTRSLSKIYDKSPVQSWVEMFNNVFKEKQLKKLRQYCIKNFVAKNFVGLAQIKNFSTPRNLLREIVLLIKYRWQNLFSLSFWFFALGTLVIPRRVLISLVDNYKNKILSKRLVGIKLGV